MAFPDDLLEVAQHLAALHPEALHQASLRRAVSTSYYALFHLLISEATVNWARPELRATLSRYFEHGNMHSASNRAVGEANAILKDSSRSTEAKVVQEHLRTVAGTFIQAQQRRNDADYDMAKEWTTVEVDAQIISVKRAFDAWKLIRTEADAQKYLLSLLGKRRKDRE